MAGFTQYKVASNLARGFDPAKNKALTSQSCDSIVKIIFFISEKH
jgi:hypothetical protein